MTKSAEDSSFAFQLGMNLNMCSYEEKLCTIGRSHFVKHFVTSRWSSYFCIASVSRENPNVFYCCLRPLPGLARVNRLYNNSLLLMYVREPTNEIKPHIDNLDDSTLMVLPCRGGGVVDPHLPPLGMVHNLRVTKARLGHSTFLFVKRSCNGTLQKKIEK